MQTSLTGEQPEGGRGGAQLRLHVLASGSKGNCSVVENVQTGESIVVDCGISKRAFMERLDASGVSPQGIQAVLVTHEHTDHTKGLGVVSRGLAKLGVRPALYASTKVAAASSHIQEIRSALEIRPLRSDDDLALAGIRVHAFHTSHDAAESFGFRFDLEGDAIGFMTDTGIVTGEAFESLQGCQVLAIEANHDPLMLKYGPYPAQLKRRIASERGHLSNAQSADLLEQLLCDELEQVIAMHISENNNNYTLPADALSAVLARNGHPAFARSSHQHTPLSIM